MKTTERKVYSCEHCKFYRLTKQSALRHELHCTNNPNRECGLCGRKSVPDFGIIKIVSNVSHEGLNSWEEKIADLEM